MVKRLRLSPLTAATRVRIPAESPKCASARCAFFHAGIQTRVRVLLCNPHPVHARVPRHFRVSPSPIGARCKANPGRVTITAHINAPFLFAGIQTRVRVLLCNPHPVHARVPRHFRVSSSPIGARCKTNPGRVPRGGGIVATRCSFAFRKMHFTWLFGCCFRTALHGFA